MFPLFPFRRRPPAPLPSHSTLRLPSHFKLPYIPCVRSDLRLPLFLTTPRGLSPAGILFRLSLFFPFFQLIAYLVFLVLYLEYEPGPSLAERQAIVWPHFPGLFSCAFDPRDRPTTTRADEPSRQSFVCPWIRTLLISLFSLFDTACASTGVTSSAPTDASRLPTSARSRFGNAASGLSLTHTFSRTHR